MSQQQHGSEGLSDGQGHPESELSLEQLESDIAEAEALVQELNQRLQQTADRSR
ncbi:hypothetical protein [Nesterenkonia sp. CF4.4]|uniref:hypothetical protein n=1 Tax=Nesterenkonia sp. CF4.4 TaxID=3373079 RepID=UPI003EE46180